jgi:sugar O-acyltransferase (sialic acid O-acetyltransferase NeuD family)
MSTQLIILGAGGFAKEAFSWATSVGYNVAAFYEEATPGAEPRAIFQTPVVNSLKAFYGMTFVAAVGNSKLRERLTGQAMGMGLVQCSPITHRSVISGVNVTADPGTIICPNVVLTADIHIGMGCIINIGATIGHDCQIGDFVTIAPGANISGGVIIQNHAYIGTNACIREGKLISESGTIGMGSVVVKDTEPYCTVMGNPAKIPVLAPRVINFNKESLE